MYIKRKIIFKITYAEGHILWSLRYKLLATLRNSRKRWNLTYLIDWNLIIGNCFKIL